MTPDPGLASILNGTAPLFYEAIDTEPDGGPTKFAVTFDVSAVKRAKGALIEFSGPESGVAVLDGKTVGLSIPAGKCDSTFQLRVFGTDGKGNILGVGGKGSVLSYADFISGGLASRRRATQFA